jgi:hypothetical protein
MHARRLVVAFLTPILLVGTMGSTTGCAAAFRSGSPPVAVETDPAEAQVRIKEHEAVMTPAVVPVARRGSTVVTIDKPGFVTHQGTVHRSMNGAWLTMDILTCAIPVLLCIPLIVDGATGAWFDIEKNYRVKLEPAGTGNPTPSMQNVAPGIQAGARLFPSVPMPTSQPAPPTSPPGPEMSESERKATARAAFLEGVDLQDKNDCAEALPRFEAAQKLYNAPTHLEHMAECQLALGKLVEAQENYETLAHIRLAPGAPEAFVAAQESAKRTLLLVKPRVPSLRIQLTPPPATISRLVVRVNDAVVPNEVLGITRPVNPGTYRIQAQAPGWRSTPADVAIREGETKAVDLKLTR